jgi:hypothetical protein
MNCDGSWLRGLRRYLAVIAVGDLAWEIAHLPLYTVWTGGTVRDKLVAVAHCTAGDVLIAVCSWAFAVFVAGRSGWPAEASGRVAMLTIAAGLAYTGYSEWLNTAVKQSWTYSELMPLIPGLGLGWSPMLQWVVVPTLALWFAARRGRRQTVSGTVSANAQVD